MRVLSTNGKYDDATGFDFRKWARECAGLELRMDNDARGALLGEWRYGAGRGVDNVMMVTFGYGGWHSCDAGWQATDGASLQRGYFGWSHSGKLRRAQVHLRCCGLPGERSLGVGACLFWFENITLMWTVL